MVNSDQMKRQTYACTTVDGQNPAPVDIILRTYPIIYRVSYIPGGAGFPPSTVEILWKHGFAWQPGSRYEGNLVFFGLGALLLTHTARIEVCGVSLGISPFAFTCIL